MMTNKGFRELCYCSKTNSFYFKNYECRRDYVSDMLNDLLLFGTLDLDIECIDEAVYELETFEELKQKWNEWKEAIQ